MKEEIKIYTIDKELTAENDINDFLKENPEVSIKHITTGRMIIIVTYQY